MERAQPDNAPPRHNLITIFCNHPVAANLLMIMMLLAGFAAMKLLNTQFFPTFKVHDVSVKTEWRGASAEDVEALVTVPLEQELHGMELLREMTSTSAAGVSSITLKFEEGTDIGLAVDRAKEQVNAVNNLPVGAESPEVSHLVQYEQIARLLIVGPDDLRELYPLVNRFESELLDRGIANVRINGLPEEVIAIEVPSQALRRLGLSLEELGRRVSSWSRDMSAGTVAREEFSRQLRFRERQESVSGFAAIPVLVEPQGRLVTLGDIADISRRPDDAHVTVSYQGRPAVEMILSRTEGKDSLAAARIYRQWLQETRATLPRGVRVIPFSQSWELLWSRISLLINNGGGGLLLVLFMLFLFMNARVAWWTAAGIPVSLMAALMVLYLAGGSINMVSLFGLIMSLGIIVDDAIVVGENAMTRYQRGTGPLLAPQESAHRMLGPVFTSSLTTIAAFVPLLILGGEMGAILQAIPTVVICVILVSLIECFLILPGHLTHSFRKMGSYRPNRFRNALNRGFDFLRDRIFRSLARLAVSNRWSTLAVFLGFMMLTVGWVQSGRANFEFFPVAEGDRIYANVSFVSGTPADRTDQFLAAAEQALYRVEEQAGEKLFNLVLAMHGTVEKPGERAVPYGDHHGTIQVELVDPDARTVRNRDIIAAWEASMPQFPGVESMSIQEPRAGPPGSDIDLRISGSSITQVKVVANTIKDMLRDIPGVSGVSDDSAYGKEQLFLELNPAAQSLGLNAETVSRQLRAAYDGYLVQEFPGIHGNVKVELMLSAGERNVLSSLPGLQILLPDGRMESIANLAAVSSERGFSAIQHHDAKLAVAVSADVDPALNNTNVIRTMLEREVLPSLESTHDVRISFQGRQADQQETLAEMRLGAVAALVLIYLVLAWVFGSYGLPLIVMAIIPFGLIGAFWGHVVMGQDITILSLMGFFGLAGIIINGSIILVIFYQDCRERGMSVHEAVTEATCNRFRAVLLTSLTTIAGLVPLLFETSLQAQFLVPMAISLAFGLAFGTLLVLLLVPALLIIYENACGRS